MMKKRLVVEIDEKIRREAKILVCRKGITMSCLIEELLKKYIGVCMAQYIKKEDRAKGR